MRSAPRWLCATENDEGVVLLVTLFIITVVLLAGAMLALTVTTDLRIASNVYRSTAAFYLAEAGVARAVEELKGNPHFVGQLDGSLDEGTYHVTVTAEGDDRRTIRSEGRLGKIRRVVTVTVSVGVSEAQRKVLFVTGNNIEFKAPAEIRGDVHVNGDVKVKDSVFIDGDLSLSGVLRETEDGGKGQGRGRRSELEVTGSITEGAPELSLGLYDESWYLEHADEVYYGGRVFAGPLTYQGEVIFVDGDVEIWGTLAGRLTIVSSGSIVVSGDLSYADEDSLLWLIALDRVEVEAGVLEAMVVGQKKVTIKESCDIFGGLSGEKVDYAGELRLIFDERLEQVYSPAWPSLRVEVVEWREE